jgi:hypothetical protein
MDAFKRVYSNEDTATKALPYFWEHFDPVNNSIWYGEYRFPQELTLTFMSSNLISGQAVIIARPEINTPCLGGSLLVVCSI